MASLSIHKAEKLLKSRKGSWPIHAHNMTDGWRDKIKKAAYGDTEPLWMDQDVGKVDVESKLPVKLNPRVRAPDRRPGDAPTANVTGIGAREEDGRANATTITMGTNASGDVVPDAMPANYKMSSVGTPGATGQLSTPERWLLPYSARQGLWEYRKAKESAPWPQLSGVKVGCIDELNKLGAISDEEAMKNLDQLETLEKSKPTIGQVGRYSMVGAIAGPTVSMAREMLRKGPKAGIGRYFKDVREAGRRGILPHLHHAAGDAAAGAVTSGGIPLLRASMDRSAAQGALKQYMRENTPEVQPPAPKVASAVADVAKRVPKSLLGRFWSEAQHEAAPAAGAILGAGIAGTEDVNPLAGSAAGYGLGAAADLGVRALLKKRASVEEPPSKASKFWNAMRGEIGPAVGMVIGAGGLPVIKPGASPITGAALGYGLGAIPEVVHSLKHRTPFRAEGVTFASQGEVPHA